MAASKLLKEIRDRAKLLADMEKSSFLSDAEWNANINDACFRLYNKLVDVRGADFYAKLDTSVSMVSGTAYYDLPADFFISLDITLDDGSRFINPRMFELKERAALLSLEADSNGSIDNIRYRLTPKQMEFRPAPNDTFTINHTYVPTFTELVNDTDTFDGINGWERWVEYTAAITALNKEESDTSALQAERADIERAIELLKGRRDAGRPPRIQDTRRDWAGNWWVGLEGRDWDA